MDGDSISAGRSQRADDLQPEDGFAAARRRDDMDLFVLYVPLQFGQYLLLIAAKRAVKRGRFQMSSITIPISDDSRPWAVYFYRASLYIHAAVIPHSTPEPARIQIKPILRGPH